MLVAGAGSKVERGNLRTAGGLGHAVAAYAFFMVGNLPTILQAVACIAHGVVTYAKIGGDGSIGRFRPILQLRLDQRPLRRGVEMAPGDVETARYYRAQACRSLPSVPGYGEFPH